MALQDQAAVLAMNAAARPHVAPLDAAELSRLRATSDSHLVIEDSNEVLGYALIFTDRDSYDGEEFQLFRTQTTAPFTYIDQVVVAASARGRGVGRRLYEAIEEAARSRGHGRLCCEVNLAPPNPVSLAFHTSIGFRTMQDVNTQDGRRVSLLEKSLI